MSLILIIEDEQAFQEEIQLWLEFEGYQVIATNSAGSGMELAQQHLPDLIISDIMLPDHNGYEILEELHKNSLTALIPFIFLTARTEKPDVRLGMALGADDYLTKPCSTADLLTAIRAQLEKRRLQQLQQTGQFAQQMMSKTDEKNYRLAAVLDQTIRQRLINLQTLLAMDEMPTVQVQQVLETVVNQLDLAMLDLYPAALDRLGLLPTLLWLIGEGKTGLEIQFQHDGLEHILSTATQTAAYQIIQQALHNVKTHAQTTAVTLNLWIDTPVLRGEIIDQGVGFELDHVMLHSPALGLRSMYERARAQGGSTSIQATPGAGCRVSFWLPFEARRAAPAMIMPAEAVVNPAGNRLRLVIAEEDDLICQGLVRLLSGEFEVTGVVQQLDQLQSAIKTCAPDVLVLDLGWLRHLEMIAQLLPSCPRILVLSQHLEGVMAWEALHYGAAGCVVKKQASSELVQAIHEVYAGRRYLSPALAAPDTYIQHRAARMPDPYERLTEREREVFLLVAQDYTNLQMADKLVISVRTVETHRANMMQKLGFASKSDLIRYAIKRGFI